MEDKKQKYADLHVHTHYSDGTFPPEKIIELARQNGLSCVAVCDHDCVDAIQACIEIGRASGVEVVPGVELSAEKEGIEIHLLGYFIDWKIDWFARTLKEIQESRVVRMRRMVKKVQGAGVPVDEKRVFELGGLGTIGRLHLARAILETGKITRLDDAFNKYIGDDKPCYVKDIFFDPRQAIEMITKSGGVAVFAHPGLLNRDDFITEFKEYGLGGIEVYHSDHTRRAVKKYKEMASKLDLAVTGGSDCHGLGKGSVLMGRVKVPYELVEKLRERRHRCTQIEDTDAHR